MSSLKGVIKIGPREKARFATKLAADKKAEDTVVLDLRKVVNFCDYFVICSGNSDRQVSSIAEAIEEGFLQKKIKTISSDNTGKGFWALLDYGDVVIHIFRKETREYYNLERLWIDAPRIPLSKD